MGYRTILEIFLMLFINYVYTTVQRCTLVESIDKNKSDKCLILARIFYFSLTALNELACFFCILIKIAWEKKLKSLKVYLGIQLFF